MHPGIAACAPAYIARSTEEDFELAEEARALAEEEAALEDEERCLQELILLAEMSPGTTQLGFRAAGPSVPDDEELRLAAEETAFFAVEAGLLAAEEEELAAEEAALDALDRSTEKVDESRMAEDVRPGLTDDDEADRAELAALDAEQAKFEAELAAEKLALEEGVASLRRHCELSYSRASDAPGPAHKLDEPTPLGSVQERRVLGKVPFHGAWLLGVPGALLLLVYHRVAGVLREPQTLLGLFQTRLFFAGSRSSLGSSGVFGIVRESYSGDTGKALLGNLWILE